MEFHVSCPHCAQQILLGVNHAGQTISCPYCRGDLVAPEHVGQGYIFQPFTDQELMECIHGFPNELIEQINQVEKNDRCWPCEVFAIMMDSTLNNYLVHQNYELSGGSIFATSNKGKKNIITKELEYFEIIGRMLSKLDESFCAAVDYHDIYSMCKFTELLTEHLVQLDTFFKSLESLDYPAKDPYEYLVERMISWKDELTYSIKTMVIALRNRAKLDPEQAKLSTVQMSLTPLSIYEFNNVFFGPT